MIEKRLRNKSKVIENYFAFMPERSMIEVIHQLIEKYWKKKQNLHMILLTQKKLMTNFRGRLTSIEIIKNTYKDLITNKDLITRVNLHAH